MTPLSTDERRALGILAALLLLAGGARWIERPQPLLDGVPDVDVARLEADSRDARGGAAPTAAARPAAGPVSGAGHARIDVNAATAAELVRLPGVGPALAERIVEERARGAFRDVADLQRVRGIGPAMVARIGDRAMAGGVTATGPAAVSTPPPPAGATAPAARSGGVARAPPTPPGEVPARQPIDLNRATDAELQAIRGIGPAIAARIVARRDSLGRFRGFEDVDAVAGVGPALLARLREAAVIRP